MEGFFPKSEVQRERPAGLIPKCGACGLLKLCNTPKIPPYGKGRRNVLIVGESPGEREDELGRPFVGKAGRFLREQLEEIDIDLDRDAVITNAVICRPPGNKMPKKGREVGFCRPNLIDTIQKVKPAVVITLGKWALVSVIQDFWKGDPRNLERWVGWKIPMPSYWICPTWHPSYLLRMKNGLLDRMFQQHLRNAFALDDEERPRFRDNKVEILYDEDEISATIRDIDHAGGRAAFDYETNCLKPEYELARIHSAAIANRDRTISYPWHGRAIDATSRFLRSRRTKKIASNLKFEERWTLNKLGHPVRNWDFDTMLGAHALDNREGITSLKFQSLVRMGIMSYNVNVEPYLQSEGRYNRIHEIALDTLLLYGGHDVAYELNLAELQMKDLGL